MVIIQKKTGQLANRLFLFARFIANSIEYNYELINPCFDEYRPYFKSTRVNYFNELPISVELNPPVSYTRFYLKTNLLRYTRPVTEDYEFVISTNDQPIDLNDPIFVEKARQKKIFANGWSFKERKNLYKHGDAIRRIFQPDDHVQIKIHDTISKIRSNHDVVVGVHMRKGDYRKWRGGMFYYEDNTYYANMLQLKTIFQDTGQDVAFIICSNEKISNQFFKVFSSYQTGGGVIEDLYTLAECDLIIGPPSTFSMWASFYGQNKLFMIRKRDHLINNNDLNSS